MTSLFADIIPSQAVWTIAYITVLLGLSIYGLHRYSIIHLFLKNRHAADLPPRHFEELPVVTVQLPIFNEYHVVQRLLDAVAAVDYPRDRLEIQVLDDTAEKWKDLKDWQFCCSVYGVVPARRGHLKPVGEWNEEEIIAKGSRITVKLNGHVVVDADVAEASRGGTPDGRDHPGLKRTSGHIHFCGHGDPVWFRAIDIKELK